MIENLIYFTNKKINFSFAVVQIKLFGDPTRVYVDSGAYF